MTEYMQSPARHIYASREVELPPHPAPFPLWGQESTPHEEAVLGAVKAAGNAPTAFIQRGENGAQRAILGRWYSEEHAVSVTVEHGVVVATFPDGFTAVRYGWAGVAPVFSRKTSRSASEGTDLEKR